MHLLNAVTNAANLTVTPPQHSACSASVGKRNRLNLFPVQNESLKGFNGAFYVNSFYAQHNLK